MERLSPQSKATISLLYAFTSSLEQSILDDFLLFDVGPYIINALAQTAQAGIQVGPDYIRAVAEPVGAIAEGMGQLTNLIG